jgi:DNA modification methylase
MKIEQIKVEELKPYPQNARTHSNEQIKQIKQSMIEFGFTNPILIDKDNEVIAGHGRLESAKQLKMQDVPCIRLGYLTEEQKKAYVLADNKLALNASWDIELLSSELQHLVNKRFDIDVIGFDEAELHELLDSAFGAGLVGDDDVPDIPETPTTLKGDIYKLGNHRLMCGDATNEADVSKLMNNTKADMVFTDPPYNVNYGGGRKRGHRSRLPKGRSIVSHGTILNDHMNNENFSVFLEKIFYNYYTNLKELSAIYVCHGDKDTENKISFELEFGKCFKKSCTIIWNKGHAGLGYADYRPSHEPILYGWKEAKRGKHFWCGAKNKKTVWDFKKDNAQSYVHPTQKPVQLVEEAIFNSSKGQDIILDFFGGSGSTLIACEKNKRICYTMELDPKYCDVIIKRWEDYTGQKAELIKVDSEELLRVANV